MDTLHKITNLLDKGVFSISEDLLFRMSIKNLMDWYDNHGINAKGCGYSGCTITLPDVMWEYLDGEQVNCYSCTLDNPVNVAEACPHHIYTKLEYLALRGLVVVFRGYRTKARARQVDNLPHAILQIRPNAQIYLACLNKCTEI